MTGHKATITNNSVTFNGVAPITYDPGVTSLTVLGGSGGNTFTVQSTSSFAPVTLSSGMGSDTVNVQSTSSFLTLINSGGQDTDTLGSLAPSLGGTLQNITGPVSVTNAAASGSTALILDDSADGTSRSVTITDLQVIGLAPVPVSYASGIGTVNSLAIYGGYGGNVFNVQSTSSVTPVTVHAGVGGDIVSVGNIANQLDSIQGSVSVTGQSGNATLNINDQGSTDGHVYDLEGGSVSRSPLTGPLLEPLVNFDAGVNQLSLFSGSGQNVLDVGATLANTTYDLFGNGAPFDEFFVGNTSNGFLNGIQGPLHLHDTGSPIIGFDDFGAPTSHIYNVQAYGLQRLNLAQEPDMAPVTWDISEPILFGLVTAYDLAVGPRSDQVNVLSEIPNDFFSLQVGTGDTVTIGSQGSKPGGTLASIQGFIRVSAGGEAPTVVVDDSGDTVGQNPLFQDLQVGTDSNGNPYYLPAISGKGVPTIYFEECSAATATFLGGSGNNTFSVLNQTNAPSLTLNGGTGGTNTLDYSNYIGDILVDLRLGVATGADGGISEFTNVIGSQGNDLIVGNGSPSSIIGGTGRNVIIGGGGGGTIDASVSGGDNILIGGTTDWDTNLAALNAIMAEWDRSDLAFQDRYNDLFSGSATDLNQVDGQQILLNPATVHAGSSPTTLTGGSGQNWYFVDLNDLITNFNSNTDTETIVT